MQRYFAARTFLTASDQVHAVDNHVSAFGVATANILYSSEPNLNKTTGRLFLSNSVAQSYLVLLPFKA